MAALARQSLDLSRCPSFDKTLIAALLFAAGLSSILVAVSFPAVDHPLLSSQRTVSCGYAGGKFPTVRGQSKPQVATYSGPHSLQHRALRQHALARSAHFHQAVARQHRYL